MLYSREYTGTLVSNLSFEEHANGMEWPNIKARNPMENSFSQQGVVRPSFRNHLKCKFHSGINTNHQRSPLHIICQQYAILTEN